MSTLCRNTTWICRERTDLHMRRNPLSEQLGTVFTFLLPVIYIVLGALLLFVPDLNTKVFAELLGALLAILGAAFIIHYFLTRAYLEMNAYGFSIGALAVILGICVLIRSDDVANSLSVFLNLCIMLTAIIKLQNAIQLLFLRTRLWIPVLCISLAFLVCTILITVNPFTDQVRDTFTYIVLLCDGVASFANAILLRIVMRRKPRPDRNEIIRV